ncbi:MAG: peptidase, partial [Subdoligranulum sp.]|nr:peptidase [Subdoligranulum sp.]
MKTEWNVPHRLLAGLTALALLLMLALPVWAEGEETEKMPISINSVDDLLQLVKGCRLDSWSEGRTVDLNADLDLTGVDFAGIPSFSGTFDGNHHTVSGLSLVDDGSVTGFFRYIQDDGVVHDLTIRG